MQGQIAIGCLRCVDGLCTIVEGAPAAPVVSDDGTGETVELAPALASGFDAVPAGHVIPAHGRRALPGLFKDELPLPPHACEARLSVTVGDTVPRVTARFPSVAPRPETEGSGQRARKTAGAMRLRAPRRR